MTDSLWKMKARLRCGVAVGPACTHPQHIPQGRCGFWDGLPPHPRRVLLPVCIPSVQSSGGLPSGQGGQIHLNLYKNVCVVPDTRKSMESGIKGQISFGAENFDFYAHFVMICISFGYSEDPLCA